MSRSAEAAVSDHAEVRDGPLTTMKSVVLRHAKDGTNVYLVEVPAILTNPQRMEIHTYDLGRFNSLTARTAQARIRDRFRGPDKRLTQEEVAWIKAEIHCQPFPCGDTFI